MSALPISTNRPPDATSSSEASTNSPARESSTTSTPRPPVTARNWRAKSSVREDAIRPEATPSSATSDCLAALAVANTSAPRCLASCTAAIPTPPAAAWISTDSPGRSPARSTRP